jgi:hypothetical protein
MQLTLILFFVFFGLMFNIRGPQGQGTTVSEMLAYSKAELKRNGDKASL